MALILPKLERQASLYGGYMLVVAIQRQQDQRNENDKIA